METYNAYKVAEITEKEREELTKLENTIAGETNKHIVLVAYEPKENIH